MKRLFALILILSLLCCLISCGQESKKETETQQAQTATAETVEDEGKIERGTISGNVYTSSFSGLTFTAPESWKFSNDAAIAAKLGIKENLINDNLAVTLQSTEEIYDAMANDTQSASTLTIAYSKSTPETSTADQMKKIKSDLESNSGIEVSFDEETVNVTIGQREYLRGHAEVEAVGTITNRIFYVTNIDGVMCTVTFTMFGGYDLAALEATLS